MSPTKKKATVKKTTGLPDFKPTQPIMGKVRHVHFIGIGGAGMSGIAELLYNQGFKITGSDIANNTAVMHLKKAGIPVAIGHQARLVEEADVVVISTAIKPDNPELLEARFRKIPVIRRAEMLAELMRMRYGIAIAGTHGKTTTTSIISLMLADAGYDPTMVIGGQLNSIAANAKLGAGRFLIAEADESDGSFLNLSPIYVVVTNIDRDHLDFYHDYDSIKSAFLSFINRIPFWGAAFICLDDPGNQAILPHINRRYVTYGMAASADLSATNLSYAAGRSSFDLNIGGERVGRLEINLPGRYSVYNSLAAVAVGMELGIPLDTIRESMAAFPGVQMRFQILGEENGITVMHDYAHHPAEISACLSAVKAGWDREIVAVFQPHRYSRTLHLGDEFATSFFDAREVIITDIYPAGEKPIEGVTAENIAKGLVLHGHRKVTYQPSKELIPALVLEKAKPGDIVVLLGAGDVWKISKAVLSALKERD
jgi:UDP-N-acetylmuramate--alanine ligase